MNDQEITSEIIDAINANQSAEDVEFLSPYGDSKAIHNALQKQMNTRVEDKEQMDILPIPFEPNTRRRWFDEHIRGSDSIVVTAGDSWTWGDSLGIIAKTKDLPILGWPAGEAPPGDDYEHRMSHIYGRLIADELDADLLNIARPAGANAEIHDHLIYALPFLKEKYKKITVIVCLTELGREMISDDFWVPEEVNNYIDVDSFLTDYEKIMFRSFEDNLVKVYPDVQFIFSRNFTYTYDENKADNHVDKTWMDVLQDANPQENKYPDDLRVLSSMGITPILQKMKLKNIHSKLKFTFMDQMASALLAEEWMGNNPMQSKKGTRHPLEQGHRAWADYLLPFIK